MPLEIQNLRLGEGRLIIRYKCKHGILDRVNEKHPLVILPGLSGYLCQTGARQASPQGSG